MTSGDSFHHRFLPAFAAICGCTLPVAVVAAQIDFGIAEHPWKAAALVSFTAAFAAVLTSIWTSMRVTVSAEGLNGYTINGSYQWVRWAAMKWARPTRVMLGLPYLRIGLDDGRSPLWLPMFLADMRRFEALVSSHAGPDHVLTATLSRRTRSQASGAADG